MKNNILYIIFAALLSVSCASQKAALSGKDTAAAMSRNASEAVISTVIDNAVTVDNIVGSGKMRLKAGSKDITLPASLRMRRDEVIRLQVLVPILGSEVGRIEFTPDYVLVIDRMHKQYIKASYSDVSFLKNNGLSFYSLQSLFWNELVVPGAKRVTAANAKAFDINSDNASQSVGVVLDKGNMKYQWNVSRADGKPTSAVVSYNATGTGASMLSWLYSEFTQLGRKKYPLTQDITFQTSLTGKSQQGELRLSLDNVKNNADWDALSEISKKYKQVSVEQVIKQLINF